MKRKELQVKVNFIIEAILTGFGEKNDEIK